ILRPVDTSADVPVLCGHRLPRISLNSNISSSRCSIRQISAKLMAEFISVAVNIAELFPARNSERNLKTPVLGTMENRSTKIAAGRKKYPAQNDRRPADHMK